MTFENLQTKRIGAIDLGVDGSDEYLLVWDNEQEHSAEELEQHLLERYFRDTNTPGGYFCYSVIVGRHPYYTDKFIATVFHRYDV
jgi:hypothetical protein